METNQQKTLDDILEIVTFLKDNGASKEDLRPLATKNELRNELLSVETRLKEHIETRLTEVKTEIMSHVDSFIALHQKLDTELTALRSKYSRLEAHLQFLARHLNVALPE